MKIIFNNGDVFETSNDGLITLIEQAVATMLDPENHPESPSKQQGDIYSKPWYIYRQYKPENKL